jgi:hypothetical protein
MHKRAEKRESLDRVECWIVHLNIASAELYLGNGRGGGGRNLFVRENHSAILRKLVGEHPASRPQIYFNAYLAQQPRWRKIIVARVLRQSDTDR